MLIDNQLVLSDKQAITADAASTNVLDLGVAGRAPGEDLTLLAHINEDFNTLTSLDFEVQSCAAEGFGSGVVTHQIVNKLLADLTAGTQIDLGPLLNGTLQYVRINYNVQGSNPTTGQVTTVIVPFGQQTLPGQA